MNILTLYPLPAATQAAAVAAHPAWRFITQDNYRPEDATVIDAILGWDALGAAIIAGPNRVRFVQAMSAGVDYLPLAAFATQGIRVANVAGLHAEPIAEYVLGAILASARGLLPQAHDWDGKQRYARMWTLPGTTAAIFGTGHIGDAIAMHLQAFGVRCIGIDRHGAPKAGFDAVTTDKSAAANADIVINVLPQTPATGGYFDAAFFATLTHRPLFVNVGRGATVDESALSAALGKRLRGAVLDVFQEEPLPAASPLWAADTVVLTPHIAGQVPGLRAKVADIFLANLATLQADGTLQHEVDLSAGY